MSTNHPDLTHNTQQLKSWDLTPRQLCDLEMIFSGIFAPLQGFLGEADYQQVHKHLCLANGQFWPSPVLLAVTPTFAATLTSGETLALRDAEGVMLGLLTVEEHFKAEAEDTEQPEAICLSGKLVKVALPTHYDHLAYRQSPTQLKQHFHAQDWQHVIGLLPQQALHRHQWETACAYAKQLKAGIVIQPVVGLAHTEDTAHFARIRCYRHLLQRFPTQPALLNLLHHAPREGWRETLLQALILRNSGCTHMLADTPQARLLKDYADALGITLITLPTVSETQATWLAYRDAELSHHLHQGASVPADFSYPEVLAEIQRSYPPRHRQGFVVFFTGLSGSGKSTLANALLVRLMAIGGRSVTLLDGDIVRKHLSSELNFSKEHRDINVRRIGFVASEIAKSGGIAICAPIAPYTRVRREVRQLVSDKGGFMEVHVATPLDECEKRDRKGLYAKARAGVLKGFTGIDDPYELPENPELRLDTSNLSPAECANRILQTLVTMGYLQAEQTLEPNH